MTILITGASGFVAHHFLRLMVVTKQTAKIICVYNTTPSVQTYLGLNVRWVQADLSDKKIVQHLLATHNPTHILHLAAQSSVGNSWHQPYETYQGNTIITLNILEAMRLTNCKGKVLIAGSAEVYAASTQTINEDSAIAMANIYAVSKYAQEQLADRYAKQYQINIVCTRAFNHIGPMQNTNFAIPSFAQQIAQQIKEGKSTVDLQVGNTNIVRDFSDVRDIVQAYWLLLTNNNKHFIFNICSAQGYSIQQIIDAMAIACNKTVNCTIDAARIRPIDNPIMIGDASRLQAEYKWQPTYSLQQTIKDVFASLGLMTR